MYEIGVELNGDDLVRALQQRFRQRALAGPDFDYQRLTLRARRRGDAIQNRFSNEKMLPEATAQWLALDVD